MHAAAIEALQPYNGVDWTRLLRDLSNMDKHRALHVVGYISEDRVRINAGGTDDEAKALGGFRIPGDDAAWYYPAPFVVSFVDGTPVERPLTQLLAETRRVLGSFAPAFKGHTRERTVTQTLKLLRVRVQGSDEPEDR